MKKRWLVLILALIAIAVVAAVAVMVFKDKTQNDLLISEINALSENNVNTDVKSEGQYGIVEKLVKEDYKLYIESVNKLRENYEKLTQLKVINLENYQNDGPEFTNSLETLNGIKEENKQIFDTLNSIVNESKVEERITSSGLETRHADMYKSILNDIKVEEGINSLKEMDSKYDAYNDSLISVLNYMKENGNEWFIENNTLKSKSQEFIDTYNDMVQKTNIEL